MDTAERTEIAEAAQGTQKTFQYVIPDWMEPQSFADSLHERVPGAVDAISIDRRTLTLRDIKAGFWNTRSAIQDLLDPPQNI